MFKRIAVPNYSLFDSLKTSLSEPLADGDEWARDRREADEKHLNKVEVYVKAFETAKEAKRRPGSEIRALLASIEGGSHGE